MDTNNYPPYTYPDSTTSSPRSRDLDFENSAPSSFEDHSSSTTTKVKFMVSYGGKIQPRSHDNLLSYLGGDTKILSVDRNVKFTSFYSKLSSVVSPDLSSFTFKYQLPGEDLDALISVTNDDDLELMMQEFDRVVRASGKVARLRLFLFTDQQLTSSASGSGEIRFGSASSETGILSGPDREPVRDGKFVDQHRNLQSAAPRVLSPSPTPPLPVPVPVPVPVHSNVDYLFGLDRGPVQVPGPVREQEMVHELNRLQISTQEFQHLQMQQNQQKQNVMYSSKNDDGFVEPYQKPSQISTGYWQPVEHLNPPPQHQQQVQHHQQYNPQLQPQQQQFQRPQQQQIHQQQLQQQQQQPVYMMHAQQQANAYLAQPIIRPNQGGYYPVQQQQQQQPMTAEHVYREQQAVYSMPGGAQVVRQAGESAYDNVTGRQVFYAPAPVQQGGVVAPPPYPGMSAATAAVVVSGGGGGDMRRGSGDGKIVHKVTAVSSAAV